MESKLQLTLVNDPAEITRATEEVTRLLEPFDVDPRVQFVVDLVLEEMVINVINHAYEPPAPAGSRKIDLSVEVKDHVATIRIEDDGKPFDPVQATEPDLTLPVEERPIGGLGIHLVRKMSPGMSYERRGTRNMLTLPVPLWANPGLANG